MKKIELLAPAGNMECFEAALKAGADAIYLGGKMFGARNYAGNFTDEELELAIKKAHLFAVKIYITVNTIIYEAEVKSFLKYIKKLVELHVDALILQDLGMADLVHKMYPDLELHASTQMHIHTVEGVKVASKIGFKRVVLAREVSIETIKEIRKQEPIQLEVFGHGALCAAYSGQCYMSYMVGGRSGNRGTCSQCCRKPYQVLTNKQKQNKDNYPLSMKDLCTIENIDSFLSSGVDSIKIEGRMKRYEYVYLVVSLYRKAIDAYYKKNEKTITEKDKQELDKIFNRQFTKGFLFNEDKEKIVHDKRPNHMGISIGKVIHISKGKIDIKLTDTLELKDGIRILNKKEDAGLLVQSLYKNGQKISVGHKGDTVSIPFQYQVLVGDDVRKTTDIKQIEEINLALKQEKRVPLHMFFRAKLGEKITLKVGNGKEFIEVEGNIQLEKAKNVPTLLPDIEKSLKKLGNTIYFAEKLDIEMNDTLFIPVRELNDVRRLAIEKWMDKILFREKIEERPYHIEVPHFEDRPIFSVYIQSLGQYEKIKTEKIDKIYCEEELSSQIKDCRIWTRTKRVKEMSTIGKEPFLITEVGDLLLPGKKDSDFSLNVVNSYTVALLHSFGVENVTISYECNAYQTQKIIEDYRSRYGQNPNVGVIVYGRSEVMILKYDLLKRYNTIKAQLVDEFGNAYLIQNNRYYTTIYDYKKRNEAYDPYLEIGVSNIRYHLIEEEKN